MNRFQPPGGDVTGRDDHSRLLRGAIADLDGAAQARGEFQNWLRQHVRVGEQRGNDIVLAVNEALANAVQYGCPTRMRHGLVALAAAYVEDTHILTVTVTDRGRWRLAAIPPPITSGHCPGRGFGIPLMRLLANDLRIDTSERGSRVSLVWTDLH